MKFFSLLLNSTEPGNPTIIFREIFFVSVLGFVLALILAVVINQRLFHRILQKINVTNRYSEPDLWSYIFNTDSDSWWVNVTDFENQKIYTGILDSASDTIGDILELFLIDVTVHDTTTGKEVETHHELYIARKSDNITIEFIEKINKKEGV